MLAQEYVNMSQRTSAAIAIALLCLTPIGQAASFDCAHTDTSVENLICADGPLSIADEVLGKAYIKALRASPDPGWTRKQQRQWIENIRDRCSDRDCLRDAYAHRIGQLAVMGETKAISLPKRVKSDNEACSVIADYANHGILSRLDVAPLAKQLSADELKELFGNDPPFFGWLGYWNVDLNGDGVRDHFVISVDGTMRVGTGYGLSGKKESTPATLNNFDDGNIDLSIVAVGQRYYVLAGYEEGLGKLWHMTKDGEFEPLCEFTRQKKALVKLTLGQENPVCPKVSSGDVQHVTYSLMHAIGSLPAEDRFWSKHVNDGLAQIDIDNDGNLDNVVQVDFTHGGGRGCGATYIAVTDSTRTSLPDTKLNQLLLDHLGGSQCGPNLDVFVLDGVAYVDAQAGVGNRTIFKIKGDKAEIICAFRGWLIHNVAGSDQENAK